MGVMNCKDQELKENEETVMIIVREIVRYELNDDEDIHVSEPKGVIEENVNDEDSEIILQGELLRPQPGSKNKYLARWVIMTSSGLKYYKNEYTACFWEKKPINCISYCDVEEVIERVCENYYEFEIVPKNNLGNHSKSIIKNPKKLRENNRFGSYSWGNRMKSIENLDTKFNFACKDKETYEKWINTLKETLKKIC